MTVIQPPIPLTFTHKCLGRVKDEPSSRNVSETLPAAPENSNARQTIIFSGEEATEFGNPEGGLLNGWERGREGIGLVSKSIKSLPFGIG